MYIWLIHLSKCNQLPMNMSDLATLALKVLLEDRSFVLPEALGAGEESLGAMAQ